MKNVAFHSALAARLADCALAKTAREFSAAADRLVNLGLNGQGSAAERREVRAAGRRALDAYLAWSALR